MCIIDRGNTTSQSPILRNRLRSPPIHTPTVFWAMPTDRSASISRLRKRTAKPSSSIQRMALRIAELKYWLTTRIPQEWQLDPAMELSPARYRADALFDLGSVYEDLGEFSKALDYYQQAEEWFQRDEEERHKRGITQRSEY